MNLRYLGDALDHWKGSLLERLQHAHLLSDLAADAMPTDAQDWGEADWQLFSTLLRLAPQQVLRHATALLPTHRDQYFGEIVHASDLFLDPDTGIASARVSNRSQYLLPAELHALLQMQSTRIVAVYQHIRAVPTRRRLMQIMSVLSAGAPFCCCSYESATVAMLFFSRASQRVEAIHQHHVEFLGRHAAGRTYIWHYDQEA